MHGCRHPRRRRSRRAGSAPGRAQGVRRARRRPAAGPLAACTACAPRPSPRVVVVAPPAPTWRRRGRAARAPRAVALSRRPSSRAAPSGRTRSAAASRRSARPDAHRHSRCRPPVREPRAVEAAIAAAARHGAAIVGRPRHRHGQAGAPGRLDRGDAAAPAACGWRRRRRSSAPTSSAPRTRDRQRQAAATDDAALVEQLGVRVYVVPGNPENRKITTPEDLRWAEWLLAQPPGSR